MSTDNQRPCGPPEDLSSRRDSRKVTAVAIAAEYAHVPISSKLQKNVLACAAAGERDPVEVKLVVITALQRTVAA